MLRPCTPEHRQRCADRTPDPAHLAWACSQCNRKSSQSLHPYTDYLLRLRRLVRAGYPLQSGDLGIQAWEDLGIVTEAVDWAWMANR